MTPGQVDNRGPVLVLVGLIMAAFIAVASGLGDTPEQPEPPPVGPSVTPTEAPEPQKRDRKPDKREKREKPKNRSAALGAVR